MADNKSVRNRYSKSEPTRSDVTAAVNFAYKTIGDLANFARTKTDDLMSKLLQISVSEFCNFNTKNGIFMLRLMDINSKEIDITLRNIGNDAAFNGDGSQITSMALSPSYAADRNYADLYAKHVNKRESGGYDTTRQRNSDVVLNYKNHNEIYGTTTNLYPDDVENQGEFSNKWNVGDNLDSILYKTKKLFNNSKINTIISRFHTDPTSPEGIGDKRTKYGMSHGRNLLTKQAEEKNGKYFINGYDNPYCRVWTHHYQYDRLDKLIRPFYTSTDEARENTEVTKLKDFHVWGDKFKTEGKEWGWKSEKNNGWEKSVLNDNGFVNITPKYRGGGASNIHTKQCMFSIENLAWQGYDPYSFEQALSWEQRGPFGGRIMWFPPYGISFNETTSVQWNSNTFIGRGEDVYTYTNTIRQGTLNFMLLVDHPSIIDYVSWDDLNNSKASDTDLLRFFAGCDSGDSSDPNSLLSKVTPTPLTDEYTQKDDSESVKVDENKFPTPIQPEPDVKDTYDIVFYVFYPNNYAGSYDTPGSTVEAMAYLLAGSYAQKISETGATEDLPISFDELYKNVGNGYEMGDNGISSNVKSDKENSGNKKNCINGHVTLWKQTQNKKYQFSNKKWYYRIDGQYEFPSNESEMNRNTYDQTLLYKNNYSDNGSYGLNSKKNIVREHFGIDESVKLYSFAEIAAAITKDDNVLAKIVTNSSGGVNKDSEEFKVLKEIFQGDDTGNRTYKITNIISEGYSNSHGNNTEKINDDRNNILARNRAISVNKWLQSEGVVVETSDPNNNGFNIGVLHPSTLVSSSDKLDASGITAKMYRSAKVTISIEKTTTKKLSETDQEYGIDENGNKVKLSEYTRFTGWAAEGVDENGNTLYKNINETDVSKKGRLWIYDEKTQRMIFKDNAEINKRAYGGLYQDKNGTDESAYIHYEGETNKVRYDQEYHFYKLLEKKDPIVFESLMQKIKYFDPAFHSGTPEGFNARLTFLQQCTRQGNTVGASDENYKSANNLAFGRPPVCVLRLGDFYYSKIIIENISINYDPLQWDLNTEGLGVQPLIANVSLSFKFIGGQDMSGAISRLQNAMSFNYYANTRLYDNRADRVEYEFDQKEGGAVSHDIKVADSEFYSTKMKK